MADKICKVMGFARRQKKIQGRVVNQEFDFLNPEAMEIVTLKCVLSDQKQMVCDPNCYFRTLQSKSAELDAHIKNQKTRTPFRARIYIYNWKAWPCYLHACSAIDRKDFQDAAGKIGNIGHVQTHYEVVSKEKINQETSQEN